MIRWRVTSEEVLERLMDIDKALNYLAYQGYSWFGGFLESMEFGYEESIKYLNGEY
jgi:hypothetical protein